MDPVVIVGFGFGLPVIDCGAMPMLKNLGFGIGSQEPARDFVGVLVAAKSEEGIFAAEGEPIIQRLSAIASCIGPDAAILAQQVEAN